MNLLQRRLRHIYEISYRSVVKYELTKILKTRICDIQNEILDGIKIRARLDDLSEGEKMSSHLLGKEKKKNDNIVISRIQNGDGTIIENTDGISLFIKEHFENIFNMVNGDEKCIDYFLDKCQPVLNDENIALLNGELEEDEVWKAIKNMRNNKTPGCDGLLVEFYKKV